MTYLEWLSEIAIPDNDIRGLYQKLMLALYETTFEWTVEHDENRAFDGEELRDNYESEFGQRCEKSGPCSVLEMLVALASRCEKNIMYDPDYGDRTGEWFWEMIENLGLNEMDDWWFDYNHFQDIIFVFLNRKYDKDGYGGPFFIEGFDRDMRKIELWYQMNYYLKSKYLW